MNAGNPDLNVSGLDVLTTGLNLAELDLHGGERFWDEVARFTRESRLEDLVDRCMGGRAAPRLWAIMEAPGSGPAAAAAGLGVARVLADRGQAVALLDVDEKEPRLTRWLGRVEQEGWIDMVRFGASLHAASAPLPSDNRRGSVIGVGSFSPTGVTPDEVGDLLGRLRHQADDLVMVLPAKLRSQPWLEAAHMRLLCWDLLARDRADTETIVSELERMGGAPEAVLGFGVEEYLAIQDRLREDVASAEPAASPEPTAAMTPDLESEAEPESEGAVPPPPVETEDEAEVEPAASGSAGTRRRRSSGLFVFAAVAAVAALVLIGVFVVAQRQSPEGRPAEVATARVDGAPGAADVLPPPPAPAADDELATGEAGDGVATDSVAADGNEGVEPPGEASAGVADTGGRWRTGAAAGTGRARRARSGSRRRWVGWSRSDAFPRARGRGGLDAVALLAADRGRRGSRGARAGAARTGGRAPGRRYRGTRALVPRLHRQLRHAGAGQRGGPGAPGPARS